MRILVIDDQPMRATKLLQCHDIRIAHGFDQVQFWFRHWTPQLVCLDNDMPAMEGYAIAFNFKHQFLGMPIWIWSWNMQRADDIEHFLRTWHEENSVPAQIWKEAVDFDPIKQMRGRIPNF